MYLEMWRLRFFFNQKLFIYYTSEKILLENVLFQASPKKGEKQLVGIWFFNVTYDGDPQAKNDRLPMKTLKANISWKKFFPYISEAYFIGLFGK